MTSKNINWSAISVSAAIALLLGFFIHAIFHRCPESEVGDKELIETLKTQNVILSTKVDFRDSLLRINEKQQKIHDSIIIQNHKVLKNDYEKIKNFTPDARMHYIDSLLKRANIRK